MLERWPCEAFNIMHIIFQLFWICFSAVDIMRIMLYAGGVARYPGASGTVEVVGVERLFALREGMADKWAARNYQRRRDGAAAFLAAIKREGLQKV